jgi:hypothetical protein
LDRSEKQVGAVLMSHMLPFLDPRPRKLLDDCDRAGMMPPVRCISARDSVSKYVIHPRPELPILVA